MTWFKSPTRNVETIHRTNQCAQVRRGALTPCPKSAGACSLHPAPGRRHLPTVRAPHSPPRRPPWRNAWVLLCEFLARHQGDPGRPGSPAWFRWRALLAGAFRVLFLPPKRVAGADRCRAAAWLRPQHLANLHLARRWPGLCSCCGLAAASLLAHSHPARSMAGYAHSNRTPGCMEL